MIKILVILFAFHFELSAQTPAKYTANQLAIDTNFRYTDHYYNYSVVKEDKNTIKQFANQREKLFKELAFKCEGIGVVHGPILSDGKWGAGHINNVTKLDIESKELIITLNESEGNLIIKVDATGKIEAVQKLKPKDYNLTFSNEPPTEQLPKHFNECYLFLSYDLLSEINHPNFSHQKMNRIVEGYMLLLEKDNYGSVSGHKIIFRSFIELKGIDKWELIRNE